MHPITITLIILVGIPDLPLGSSYFTGRNRITMSLRGKGSREEEVIMKYEGSEEI